MGRPREFDVERALQQSMELFWTKGFKSTSFEDLTRTTQVKKQSLYCVFDDKRTLFLKALALYREHSIAVLEEVVAEDMCPVKKLEYICQLMLGQHDETIHKGCLMVNTALEFGADDEEVVHEVESMFVEVEQILEKVIRSGQEQHLITSRYSSKQLAAHLNNAILGVKVLEKSGASRERIEAVLRTSFGLLVT
ncbi:TetR/AcrR family transcriptional regulator [Alicyclobacillus fastidiosus]|uniref:TetR/AcrR family transcriptional regulator n=1 Tax=Alicyclobacillus fastidiosus TaxID=392011 RepID=A0ABV5AKN3_9BACL|nr:TetR/AcrR family transcriptional regulator [Alicyclobacillus fastidiosus]WEH08310.1 TetR/AcrR family transcriptional regulator [Alicyclobacillus fastidiosus]